MSELSKEARAALERAGKIIANKHKRIKYLEDIIIDGHIHVMPECGAEHFENRSCWCEPQLDYKDPETMKEVWIHQDTRDTGFN